MLSDADLTYMRECIEDLLPDTCNILSSTYTPDGQGGGTVTWGTATAGVSCRKDTKQRKFEDIADGVQSYREEMFTIPYNTTISEENRIEFSGTQYNIMSITDGSWLASKRVQVSEV